MNGPGTAREALIAEAIGDASRLLRQVEALVPAIEDACQAIHRANASLHAELDGFERRLTAITDASKAKVVNYIVTRVDDASKRSFQEQSRAMADAARIAFGAELGATIQRLQTVLQPLIDRRQARWDAWLAHAATVAVTICATLMLSWWLSPH